jgi:hypothetical protein
LGGKPFSFEISVSNWLKKSKFMGERKFQFAALSDGDQEKWIIYLEFARSKSVYDEFVN